MGWKEKYIYGEAGVSHLVLGLILIFVALALIILLYGVTSSSPSGDIIILDMSPEEYSSGLVGLGLAILFFGVWGGFEIGRYVQSEFSKRRTPNK